MSRSAGGGVDPRWNNLVAGWKLDEYSDGLGAVARADVLGVYELTDNNTVASAAGKIDNGASFVALNSEALSNATLEIARNWANGLTIAFWIKPLILDSTDTLMSQYFTGKQVLFNVFAAGNLLFNYTGQDGVASLAASGNGTILIGSWYFVAAWFDPADGKARLSLNDGVVKVGAATTTITNAKSTNFSIGNLTVASTDSVVDEFYIFDRVKDAAWITDMYNAGAGRGYPS